MKLRTSLTASRDGSLVDATDENLITDAACAHALMQAIANKRHACSDRGQHDICVSLDTVIRYADEIMAGWGFDSEEDAR